MKQSMLPSRLSSAGLDFGRPGLLLSAGIAMLACAFSCDPATLKTPPQPPPVPDSAAVLITNKREQDPSSLTFHLFDGNARQAEPATLEHTIGDVPFESTRTFKIPAGVWKIAYSDSTGGFIQMPEEEEALPNNSDWPTVRIKADGTYFLGLTTDGNRDKWTHIFDAP